MPIKYFTDHGLQTSVLRHVPGQALPSTFAAASDCGRKVGRVTVRTIDDGLSL